MKIYNFACLVYKQLLIFPQVAGLPEHLAKNLSSIHVCLEVSQADFSRLLHLEWKYFAHLFRFAVTKESPYYSFGQCHCPDCFKPFLQARILYINLIFFKKKRIESCQRIFSLGEGLAVKPSPLKCPSALLKLFWNICSSTRYYNNIMNSMGHFCSKLNFFEMISKNNSCMKSSYFEQLIGNYSYSYQFRWIIAVWSIHPYHSDPSFSIVLFIRLKSFPWSTEKFGLSGRKLQITKDL